MATFLNYKVTYAPSALSRNLSTITVGEALRAISSGAYKYIVERARSVYNTDIEEYAHLKKQLSVFMFSGVFEGGKGIGGLIEYNRLVVLDIDHLSCQEMDRIKICLQSDPYICAFWISPSGYGIKALVELDYGDEDIDVTRAYGLHVQAFNILRDYFEASYSISLDKSGSNINRLCYISHDPELYCNSTPQSFMINISESKGLLREEALAHKNRILNYNGENYKKLRHDRNLVRSRIIVASIIKYLKSKKKSITFSYEDWVAVAFAIAETFNYDIGLKYFLALSKLDGPARYDEEACINLLRYCYENSMGRLHLGTIIYMAQKQGYTKRVLKSGN